MCCSSAVVEVVVVVVVVMVVVAKAKRERDRVCCYSLLAAQTITSKSAQTSEEWGN